MNPGQVLYELISWIVQVLTWVIIIDAILSWFPTVDRYHPIVVAIRRITTPIYRPIRMLIPPEKTGYLDLSPLIAIILLQIVMMIVGSILVPR